MKTCKVDGCEKLAEGSWGMCHMHYKRVQLGRPVGPATPLKRPAGTGALNHSGYVVVSKGSKGGAVRKFAHVLVAEKALGKSLPPSALVHHVNKNPADNRPENLVVCPDQAYHKLIHQRMDAFEACGHADWRKCKFCKQYDAPENLYVRERQAYHRACDAARNRAAYKRRTA